MRLAESASLPPLSSARRLLLWGIAVGSILLAASIISLPVQTLGALNLQAGQPSPQEFIAPRNLSFPSELLTQAAREKAAEAVADIYDDPEPNIRRQQVALFRVALATIDTTRANTSVIFNEKVAELERLANAPLPKEMAQRILRFSSDEWLAVRQEADRLVNSVLQLPIRTNQVEDMKRSLPFRLNVDLDDAQGEAVLELVRPFVVPNSLYNEKATLDARQAARDEVQPITRQFVRGQVVVTRGRIITEEDLEALRALGVLQPELDPTRTASAVAAVIITGLLVAIYMRRFHPQTSQNPKTLLLLGLLFNAFLLAAQFLIPGRTLAPYFFPAAALAMTLTVLVGPNLAITVVVALGALVGYIGGNSLELTIYTALGGIVAAIALGKAERVDLFFWAGLASALAGLGILIVFRLGSASTDLIGVAQLTAASMINGGISAVLPLLIFFVLGGVFDVTTSLQLVELARADHPLLRLVLRNAPGTYQHSLQVANLAEQAAECIGGNVMLIRVGALYHDAGKALHPQYFIENQLDQSNVHDELDPTMSAHVIIRHVTDGLELARKHRLPSRIRDFIAEHHGTMMTMYQYKRAVEAAGGDANKIDKGNFQYPGPRPRSRETAILMLADGCEAKTRSDRPRTEEDIDRIVKGLIEDRLSQGQLNDCDLTLRDLQEIRASFVNTLRGVFHPRVQYPELEPAPNPEEKPASA